MNDKVVRAVAVGLLFLGLTMFTASKIHKMFQIRGWLPGAVIQKRKCFRSTMKKGTTRNTFWISWTNDDIRKPGSHRNNIEFPEWQQTEIGDSVELIVIPGDPHPYFRDGIFASTGNIAIDFIFLLIEISLIVFLGIRIYLGQHYHCLKYYNTGWTLSKMLLVMAVLAGILISNRASLATNFFSQSALILILAFSGLYSLAGILEYLRARKHSCPFCGNHPAEIDPDIWACISCQLDAETKQMAIDLTDLKK